MYRVRRAVSVPLAIVFACVSVPLLSGCFGSVESAINGAVQGATGGEVSLGGKLPKGWPSEVPVIDGKILFGAGGSSDGEKGWVVTIKSEAADPLADARKQLEDAGFVVDTDAATSGGEVGVVAVKNDHYGVLVAGSADGVLYTVTPVEAGVTTG
ncbi:hypothetical protein [Glaciibacter sp. 2TAF33]|uniref:hypothetical protein n=1 Tax=Glaciibacter sp. 2TAF33 TaxID=3233015 RepID=UPI003F8E05DF